MPCRVPSRLLVALTAATLTAQVADSTTNTLANITTGDVTVGTDGSFPLLILGDNAPLPNSAQGVIGRNGTAKSREVRCQRERAHRPDQVLPPAQAMNSKTSVA